jgi:hypothetical protein
VPLARSAHLILLRVRDAQHRVDAHAMLGRDHAHAWPVLPAQIGEDGAFDVCIGRALS